MQNCDVILYWSGGKDCALSLHYLRTAERYRHLGVRFLLTTFTEGYDRVTGHGLRRDVLEKQASCTAIELHETYISKHATMTEYESVIESALARRCGEGVSVAAAGDIFVEKGRVSTIKKMGMKGCFPLWNQSSQVHVRAFLELGFKAYVVCVDSAALDRSFVGRPLDEGFLNDLPPHVDPCGEYGEYHTFVYDGPIFREPVRCRLGETIQRELFYFSDVILE